MADLNLSDAMAIITPETVIPVVIVGAALAVFLWRMPARVYAPTLLALWTVGVAFLAVMGAGRWAEGSNHWSAWVGTSVLWTLFIGVGGAVVALSRLVIRRRGP
jgi:hypothetical protein